MPQSQLFNHPEYEFIGKAVYFSNQKILAVGDLHLGYEEFVSNDSLAPKMQAYRTKSDLMQIFETLKKQKKPVEKIILLGDIKHCFSYEKQEKNIFIETMLLLEKYIQSRNIILIKGNHERMSGLAGRNFLSCYKENELLFVHGDIISPEMFNKNVRTIIMSHLHPAITLKDSETEKKEHYKCFLTGKYIGKDIIILPSFFPLKEGTSLNYFLSDTSCVIPAKQLLKFNIHLIGKNKAYNFSTLEKFLKLNTCQYKSL